MEEKEKLEWTLEKEEEQDKQDEQEEKQEQESKIDKIAFADYMLTLMPQEILDALEMGQDVAQVMAQAENRKLKKENEELKARLSRTVRNPLTLTGTGGEKEKDPFARGFMQAMTDY